MMNEKKYQKKLYLPLTFFIQNIQSNDIIKKSMLNVTKRNGSKEIAKFDKITKRLEDLCTKSPKLDCDVVIVSQKVVAGIYDGVTTSELDELAAQTAAYLSTQHPDYAILASRLSISNLHKNTLSSFSDTMELLYDYINPDTKKPSPLISNEVFSIIEQHGEEIDMEINHENDYLFDYFGFKTMERSYLLRIQNVVVERPQYMLMRVAIGIHKHDIKAAFETYHAMSEKFFIHATPTLFNAGTPNPQMSSCFLLTMKDDSIEGIFETLKHCACISKYAGGIGLAIHRIRASGSYIAGTNGHSNGIVPMLRVYNDAARYVDQGGGKRKGSFAVYLEPWHADIELFLEMRKNHGKEEQRGRDLFYALWIPDLFMKRVEHNETWTLFCPNEAPGLFNCYGKKFELLYEKYEQEGRGRKIMKAQDLWSQILTSQIETGTPYMLYKDACNEKSNQKNLGTIQCSNLCTEIIEYTAPDEIAVCNLASINLSKFVDEKKNTFDFDKLYEMTKIVTRNLNRVIDENFYPLKEAANNNFRNRPIGIGVQGLADAFLMLKIAFESERAKKLNRDIFETIYFSACEASNELAMIFGPYETFKGSPMSQGLFQFDLWNEKPNMYDWEKLRENIQKYGIRNSLLVAPMPTASTSQILGNNECFEPYTTNIYIRRVLAGEFPVINRHLLKDLMRYGFWTPDIRNQIIADGGSVQNIHILPLWIRLLYKTAWEIKQRSIIDLARGRAPFIDQSQSLNIFMSDVSVSKLTSMHFYTWKQGLKTGMYYLRTRPVVNAIQFTVDQEALKRTRSEQEQQQYIKGIQILQHDKGDEHSSSSSEDEEKKQVVCNEEVCLMCSS